MKNILTFFLLMGLPVSCMALGKQKNSVKVTPDTTFAKKIFVEQKNVLTGGDGCISIPLGEDKSLFLWGDSFIGEVKDNKKYITSHLVFGNVLLTVGKDGAKTYFGGTPDNPTAYLVADSIDGHKAVLWPEHGFVKNNILHLFFSNIVTYGTGTWDFYWHSLVYYRLSVDDFSVIDKKVILSKEVNGIHFGSSFLFDGEDIYTYGTKTIDNKSHLYLAKTKLVDDKISSFLFYNGESWNSSPDQTIPLKGVDTNVSEQFSVFKFKDKYILITQERGINVNDIYSFTAESIKGPWGNKKLIYTTPEPLKDSTLFSYNTMAHPQYIRNGKLLISYCINSHKMEPLFIDPSIYRPRFIWVKLKDLVK